MRQMDYLTIRDGAFEAMHGEVQAAEASGFIGFLDVVDGEFRGGRFFLCSETKRAEETNMPPEPHAGSRMGNGVRRPDFIGHSSYE